MNASCLEKMVCFGVLLDSIQCAGIGMQILFPFSWGVDLFSAAVGIAAFIAIQKLKTDLKAVVARAALAGFTLREYGRDHYRRVLAVVFLNGTDFALTIRFFIKQRK